MVNHQIDLEVRGQQILDQLNAALELLKREIGKNGSEIYSAYLHGQIYGLATALRIMFPGPGNLGEQAALAVRPVITEHRCECDDQDGK